MNGSADLADAPLPEEHRPGRGQLQEGRDDQEYGREEDQEREAAGDVQGALDAISTRVHRRNEREEALALQGRTRRFAVRGIALHANRETRHDVRPQAEAQLVPQHESQIDAGNRRGQSPPAPTDSRTSR